MIRIHEETTPNPSRPLLRLRDREDRSQDSSPTLDGVETPYPQRWVATKLLEGDEEIEGFAYTRKPALRERVAEARRRIEEMHGHDAASVIASERYALTRVR